MKSIEAINAIIILVLGVLVLLAVLGLFMGVWSPAKSGTSLQVATQTTCAKVNPAYCNSACKAARTTVDDFDANHNGTLNEHAFNAAEGYTGWDQDTLEQLCYWYYGIPRLWGTAENVKKCLVDICGCPNYGIIC